MTSSVNPVKYCKNPELYRNDPTLTNATRLYWDQYCIAMEELASLKAPDSKGVGDCSKEIFTNLALSFTTVEGLKLFVMNYGGEKVLGKISKSITNAFKATLSKAEIAAAEKIIRQKMTKTAFNTALVSGRAIKAIQLADIAIAKEAGYYAGRASVVRMMAVFRLFSSFLKYVDAVTTVLTIVGMIYDTWDPCKLNTRISNSQLGLFSSKFDIAFRDMFLAEYSIGTDANGNKLYGTNWPIKFYLEDTVLTTYKREKYDIMRLVLSAQYLDSLQFNSDGDPIFKYNGGRIIKNEDLQGIYLSLVKVLGSENTLVQNWLWKWWSIPVGILLLLIIIFIVIKGKKDA